MLFDSYLILLLKGLVGLTLNSTSMESLHQIRTLAAFGKSALSSFTGYDFELVQMHLAAHAVAFGTVGDLLRISQSLSACSIALFEQCILVGS